jgi:hypothetical protein
MRLLLDTHAFIWFVENDEQLPLAVKETGKRIFCIFGVLNIDSQFVLKH